jgi:hypothetical protein
MITYVFINFQTNSTYTKNNNIKAILIYFIILFIDENVLCELQ